ncbi:alpha-L-rhamnosidase-related protein [Pararhodonellum marinum]|uniref:alpha-L-rhamnosidase-related protein n=1 Tax=Pararhodonellum marinum TaxID=2755358 RepID=UPI00188F7309|nr:alpha-L-rhamnosidase C-terminal domain-containing protein [Pararhodonellum marinum]
MKFRQYFCLSLLALVCNMASGQSLYWIRESGAERNEYVFFRKEFQLNKLPDSAELNLYADSRYVLYVNGSYLGFGPVRSFHAHPYFDTHDLIPYLKTGENVITVLALCNGMETFQLFDYHGGVAIWGEITSPDQKISLDTESWRARKSLGYDQTTPRFSFAQGPIESWDSSKDKGWLDTKQNLEGWQIPVKLSSQNNWGEMAPRPIAPLTKQELQAIRTFGVYPILDVEEIHSFRIPSRDENIREYSKPYMGLAYTFIYSPREQVVTAGLWWGEHVLNGKKLKQLPNQSRDNYRQDHALPLKKGWNSFLVRNRIIWGTWDFYMALPKDKGLVISSSQQTNALEPFRSFAPLDPVIDEKIQELDLTQPLERIREIGLWEIHQAAANQPARDVAWYEPDLEKQILPAGPVPGKILLPDNPSGHTLFMDLGETQLGHLFVEGDFPEGTIIDIGFSEELDQDGLPWLYKRPQIGAGLKFVTAAGQTRYQSFKPYGARYLKINIRGTAGPKTISKVGVIRQVYPFETAGSFSCSNPLFDRIWEASWRTLQLCAEDAYTDTPFRERGLYAGDMLPQQAITMAISGDMDLIRHSLHVFQDMYREEMWEGEPNVHDDYPLATLIALDVYSQYTGDWSLVEAYYPAYKSLLGHHLNRKNEAGLIHTESVFIEWSEINKKNAIMTAFQAMMHHSLKVMANWSGKLGLEEDKAYFDSEAASLGQAVNEVLFDTEARNYQDGIKEGEFLAKKHLSSSIWAALFGISDSRQSDDILEWLKVELEDIGQETRKRKISPYSSFYLFSLLYQAGDAGTAEQFIHKHWGPMALHNDKPTVWENFDVTGVLGTSSHAWTGHPAFFFATETLGVNLGFFKDFSADLIEIQPQSESLTWAKGRVMHPLGPVDVSWEIKGDNLFLEYSVPEGAEVRISPRGKLGQLNLISIKK